DFHVTGVQTCALPICPPTPRRHSCHAARDEQRRERGPERTLRQLSRKSPPLPAQPGRVISSGLTIKSYSCAVTRPVSSASSRREIGRASCRESVATSM